ncbi:hypothetical protein [Mycobacteroides chelonae]|uniref:hypothetical protein n=1 Tax=Mycobacteroides chelonae TaxID=1774 RepID=UPI0008AA3DE5|nr:hypothetical protein [Mycobacteroides chelonae]OHU63981.1 hypothetical protein BKG85_11130 [Mycobacteroides chelonae]
MSSQIVTTFKIGSDGDTVDIGFTGIPITSSGEFFSWLGTDAGINALADSFVLAAKESGRFPEDFIAELEQI